MEGIITVEPTEEEAAQIQQTMKRYFAEIQQLRERMRQDQAEIEKSQARTEDVLARLQTELARLQAN